MSWQALLPAATKGLERTMQVDRRVGRVREDEGAPPHVLRPDERLRQGEARRSVQETSPLLRLPQGRQSFLRDFWAARPRGTGGRSRALGSSKPFVQSSNSNVDLSGYSR